ncbi:tail fiber domain-containing protein [Peredibacter sp. HCB2-198]|uniref:tail fiber domain-containing protein n=1 Tax=Peredibacter sp. HCB2-198 TaxID=3383025 RepID=UPI0038B4AFCC
MLKRQGGFSLVQVLMSIGLLSALGVGVAQLIQDSSKAVSKMEVDTDLVVVYRSIMGALSDPLNCTETFRNQLATNSPNAATQIKKEVKGVFIDEFPTSAVDPNRIYGSKHLKILRYSLSDAAADVDVATKNTTHLIVEFDRGIGKVGSKIITKKIVLNVQVNASNQITSCSAVGEAGGDIWKYAANQTDIFFSGGNVGIGLNVPTSTLDVVKNFTGINNASAGFIGGVDTGFSRTGVYFAQKGTALGAADTKLMNVVSNNSAKFVIDGTGNVGINTNIPDEKFHVYRGNAKVYIDGNGAGVPAGLFLTGNNILNQQFGLFFGTDGPIYERGLVYDVATAKVSIVNSGSSTTRIPRLVVKPDGNIGIGETDPLHLLSLKAHGTLAGNDAQIMIKDPDNTSRALGIGFEQTNGVQTFGFIQTVPDGFAMYPNLNIQANGGFVGIGTTTPSHKLDVVGTNGTTVASFSDGSQSCSIRPATAGNITCSSDERLKKNIRAYSDSEALKNILKLQTVTYEWKSINNGRHTGYIAQAVEKVAPEFVSTDKSGHKQIGYMGFIPWITSAVKELHKLFTEHANESNDRIKKLEAENAELRARLERIENRMFK